MIKGKKIIIVLPAYNAEKTLKETHDEIPMDIVDDIILVDDASSDRTVELAERMNLKTIVHSNNKGYGGNQKTCYKEALKAGADIVIMLHPDYQYSPKLIASMAHLVASDHFDVVIGSRILGVGALKGGMPLYKYLSNRLLTFIQNIMVGYKLSEYHTGYRAFSRKVLESLPLEENSDNFIFDNQILAQCIYNNFDIGEISCPTKYFPEASSINFINSVKYGFGVLFTSLLFFLCKRKVIHHKIFDPNGKKLS